MNNKKINKIMHEIEQYLIEINKYLPIDEEALEKEKEKQYIISFILEQIANECINLSNNVVSEFNLKTPETSKEVFDILFQANIIKKENLNKLKELVSIRNIIAHRYTNISLEILAEHANSLDYLEDFLDQLSRKLNNISKNKQNKILK